MAKMERPKSKKIFTPDVNIKTAQENITRSVWPISGCIIRNKETIDTKTIDNKYFK